MQSREEKLEYGRQWRVANREKMQTYHSAYRARNREDHNARNKAWREANSERHKAMKRAWYDANVERAKASARRNALKRQYGLTVEQVECMLEEQGNACAICKSTEPCGKGWHVDHCHTNGHVRGVLCNHCNLMLGYSRDKTSTLLAAVDYLKG